MSVKLAFCMRCNRKVRYNIKTVPSEAKVKGLVMLYDKSVARCAYCGGEVYVSEINDLNVEERAKKYRDMTGT